MIPGIRIITVDDSDYEERLDVYITSRIPELSRSFIQKLIEDSAVTVNAKVPRSSYKIHTGDEISISIPEPESYEIEPIPMDLDILYEDDDILALNKPAGLVVHPACGHKNDTLVNALVHYNPRLSSIGGKLRPGIVHRLDKDTSGIMLIAKNDIAHHKLSEQFKDRTVNKEYVCFIRGQIQPNYGIIDRPIGRDKQNRKKFAIEDDGKDAVTIYNTEKVFPLVSYLRINIKTGRTHQIRVHMSARGNPVVGDKQYGRSWHPSNAPADLLSFLDELERIMLHSYKIEFLHPTTDKPMSITAELPAEFIDLFNILENKC